MNATVGDIAGNAQRIRAGVETARAQGAQLVLFPELALTGYPPEDLLLREHFLRDTADAMLELAAGVEGIVAVVGFPEWARDTERAKDCAQGDATAVEQESEEFVGTPQTPRVHNAAAVLADGGVRSVYSKVHLPNYGVFDEQRYFRAGSGGAVIELGGQPIGLTVCEDLWRPGVGGDPVPEEADAGARLIVNISASPYHIGKGLERERLFAQRAREHRVHIAFCGLVGGQDELVFDGHSFVLDPNGATIARAAQFEEDLLVCELDLDRASHKEQAGAGGVWQAEAGAGRARRAQEAQTREPEHRSTAIDPLPQRLSTPLAPAEAEVYAALCLGLRDYVRKNGFAHVVLGLSGGIDSALVGCLAVDALGAERVSVAIMPSPYSSAATQDDARTLAGTLGVGVHELPIAAAMDAYAATLHGEFAGREADITEENLQARIRGNLLMALSNKFGWLVLTTGNKSEMSVGYTTLYGDLAGGFAVIKDVPKTLVYRLCEWRNASQDAPIPPSVIARAPSAELRESQRDDDSLPPYELLDRILHGYIELDHGREQLIAEGLPAEELDRTIRLVDLAEYKRRQAPPGIKITTRAFGRDRRMPITNWYR
jgi:NAD+ synthase (glutamine-hydrolysing)